MELSYESTIEELKKFQEVRLNKLSTIEMNINNLTLDDIVDVYRLLQQTRRHLEDLKDLLQ